MNGKKKGFTLIELLVVVLIIGILAAIALPQYQKAVLKSRYTTLMPIAKGIAEGNEAYFMEHGTYAEDPTELPIKGQESYPDGTTLDLQDTDEYTYVLASRADLPGLHHIIYQHHSKNFPSETHCEAAKDNKLANWVCKDAFKGTKLPGSLTTGYNSYLLDGAGHGITATAAAVLAGVACDENSEGFCSITEQANGNKVKKECEGKVQFGQNVWPSGICTYTTFSSDGTSTICDEHYATYDNGFCKGNVTGACDVAKGVCEKPYAIVKDEDGAVMQQFACPDYESCNGHGIIIQPLENGYADRLINIQCLNGLVTDKGCSTGTGSGSEAVYNYDDQGHAHIMLHSCNTFEGLTCTDENQSTSSSYAPIYEGDTYAGYRMVNTDIGGSVFTYDVNGNLVSEEWGICNDRIDWENAQCLP